ncbi:major Facilitator-like protein 5 [Elysia marginata]|uniref:Major Facilitator-like protein 5 n=1 Tax=Elysia marginata TaxID=1093978 RepID=A0AAV4J1K9_9GAST|nr:major Facilitator-like protein 5 [Elysia marginata]
MNTYFGNLLPYLSSYYQATRNEIHWYVEPLWIISVFNIVSPLSMVTCTLMEKWLGLRQTICLGGALSALSILASYMAIREPVALVLTYGFINALGTGLLFSLCTKVVLQAASTRKGLAYGVMTSFQSVGSLVNIGLAFAVINPKNTDPDLSIGNTNYFSDPELIRNVPYYFVAIGVLTVASSSVGFLLVQLVAGNLSFWNKNTIENSASKISNQTKDVVFEQGQSQETIFLNTVKSLSTNDDSTVKNRTFYHTADTTHVTQEIKGNNSNGAFSASNEHPESSTASDVDKSGPERDLTPCEALTTHRFWLILLASLFLSHTFYVLTNLYKQYGLLRIANDQVLVITGILSTVTLIATRPLAGVFSDKFGVKMTMVLTCAVSSVFMALMVVTLNLYPPLYIVMTIVEFSCSSTYFLISSLLVNELIGTTHYPSVIGLVYTARVVSSLLDPLIVEAMVETVGWDWVFVSGIVSGIISVFCSLCLPESKTK